MESVISGVSSRLLVRGRYASVLSTLPAGRSIAVPVLNRESCSTIDRSQIGVSPIFRLNQPVKSSRRKVTIHQKSPLQCCSSATSGHPSESEPEVISSKNGRNALPASLDALYRFSRPHTMIGTTIGIISVSLLAVERLSDLSPLFFAGLLEALVPALFMNLYIVGLNQLYDIEIDKGCSVETSKIDLFIVKGSLDDSISILINKPDLPVASGEYSMMTGTALVSFFAALSFVTAAVVRSWPLFWALFLSFILGTAYSVNLPFLRWKRFAAVAAMCILIVRAVIVQLAFFLHMQTFVFRRPPAFSRPLIFATAFMTFFSVVIALFKDIPDIDGDKIFGIQSFTVRLGQERVFWICVYLLEMAYSVSVAVGLVSLSPWSRLATVLGHVVLASILWARAKSLDLKSKAAITSFYMFIWKLFYAEYLLIPLVR